MIGLMFTQQVKIGVVATALMLALSFVASPTPAQATMFPGWADVSIVNPAHSQQSWATFRRAPGSFAIGNAHNGWEFYSGISSGGYTYGYVGSPDDHIQKCAWIGVTNLDAPIGAYYPPPCNLSGTIFPVESFASFINCTACTDAYPVATQAGPTCTDFNMYANVLPWRATTVPYDPVLTFAPGFVVEWRYISKDGRWIMVKIPNRADGAGAWLFIQRGCLPQVSGFPATSWTLGNG